MNTIMTTVTTVERTQRDQPLIAAWLWLVGSTLVRPLRPFCSGPIIGYSLLSHLVSALSGRYPLRPCSEVTPIQAIPLAVNVVAETMRSDCAGCALNRGMADSDGVCRTNTSDAAHASSLDWNAVEVCVEKAEANPACDESGAEEWPEATCGVWSVA